jgi:hypothetical protein
MRRLAFFRNNKHWSNMENMNDSIGRIEEALIRLHQNPQGSWGELLKGWRTPYYNFITGWLSRNGYAEADGNRLRWVGKEPNRTTAALLYEDAKGYGKAQTRTNTPRTKEKKADIAREAIYAEADKEFTPKPSAKDELTRGLAIMEHAIKAGVTDPVAFTRHLLKDNRI